MALRRHRRGYERRVHARLSWQRDRNPAERFLIELKKHRLSGAGFLVDGVGYPATLARADPSGDLGCTDRNAGEELFRSYASKFNASTKGTAIEPAPGAGPTAYCNHHCSHQSPDDRPHLNPSSSEGQPSSARNGIIFRILSLDGSSLDPAEGNGAVNLTILSSDRAIQCMLRECIGCDRSVNADGTSGEQFT